MKIDSLIIEGRKRGASDIHLTYGLAPMFRCKGILEPLDDFGVMTDELLADFAKDLISGTKAVSKDEEDIDVCYETARGDRNRINIYRQQKHKAVAIRLLNEHVPTLDELGFPKIFKDLSSLKRGLVLVTGPTGSGKSTTLAACIDYINNTRREHIITIEDPIEYVHKNKSCMINQREVGVDTKDFASSLRSALREDPDVIMVGEMRDLETIASAITAAETGHLVFSTLHTTGASATIDRIVDVFPPHQQQQIRVQLASVLKGVISQQLVPRLNNSERIAALEILLTTDAVGNMIRENKCHQLTSVLQTGVRLGMQSMDSHLAALAENNIISKENAVDYGIDKGMLMQKLYV